MNSKLSRKKAHRTSVKRNLLTSLVLYESIKTTKEKGNILKAEFDNLISKIKDDDLIARRYVATLLYDKNASKKLFEQILPRYKGKTPSFVKVFKLGVRTGDNAEMVLVELTDKKVFKDSSTKKENKSVKEEKVSG